MIAKFVEDKWDPIKLYKKEYIPKHTKLKNLDGKLVNDRQRPDTFAEYYEKIQWHNPRNVPITQGIKTTTLFQTMANINTAPIELEELEDVIRKFKNNKAPGPCGVPIEAIKLLDEESKTALLKLLNNCLRNRKVTLDMNQADLAVIFKKGLTDLP
eukprot:10897389-Heterocapsa_arctica.AAC.1